MPFTADSIWVNVSTSGLADFTMTTALAGYQTFSAAGVPNGATVHYTARTATEFENGEGVYNSGTGVVTRVTIFASSNAGAKVNFSSSPSLAISPLAEDAIFPPSGVVTDNSLVRWDGVNADAVQGSLAVVDDAGGLSVANGSVYPNVPQNSQTGNYTLVLTDLGKHIYHNSATPHTFTIPANASVAFPVGAAITFVNPSGSGVLTIAITSDTLFFAGTASTTGSRTLTAIGVATAIKTANTQWHISGTGLT